MAPATRFALLVSYLFGITALGRYWFRLSLVPQPERYHLEMDMAFWVALAFLAWPWVARIPRRAAWGVGIAAALACVPVVMHQRRAAREWGKPIDIRTTIEYKTAKWLEANMPGQRVFAPGTIGFWLNAFSDTPELAGGFDNGIVNPMLPHVIYQEYAGDKQQVGIDLLKAYGCDAVIGGGKESAEFYHPYAHAEKFLGLTELWRERGDVIYDVPRRSRSLAHVMRLSDQVQIDAGGLRYHGDPTVPGGAGQSRLSGGGISLARAGRRGDRGGPQTGAHPERADHLGQRMESVRRRAAGARLGR